MPVLGRSLASEEVFQKQKHVPWPLGMSQNLEEHIKRKEIIQKGCLLCTIVDRDGLEPFHVTVNVYWPCIKDSISVLRLLRGIMELSNMSSK